MSVIAYKDGVIAADTLVIDGSYLRSGHTTKIGRGPKGELAGAAGPAPFARKFLDWVAAGRGDDGLIGGASVESFEGLVIEADGRVIYYNQYGDGAPIDAEFTAFGSGGEVAIGAMAAGCDAVAAAEIAVRYSTVCGGQVETLRLGKE